VRAAERHSGLVGHVHRAGGLRVRALPRGVAGVAATEGGCKAVLTRLGVSVGSQVTMLGGIAGLFSVVG
jgi:hypothetical protein